MADERSTAGTARLPEAGSVAAVFVVEPDPPRARAGAATIVPPALPGPGAAAPPEPAADAGIPVATLFDAAAEALSMLPNGPEAYELTSLPTAAEAVTALAEIRPASLLLSAGLPADDVADVLKAVHASAPGTPVLLFEPEAGSDPAPYTELADRCGAETVRTPAQAMERLTLHLLTAARQPAPATAAAEPELPRFGGEKVLIVDDDIRSVFALTSALELAGLTVVYAGNGLDGVAVLDRDEEIRAVLMDIAMPGLDGFATAARIRELDRGRTVPIVAVTVAADHADRAKSLAAGMDEHVAKPVDVGHLLRVLRTLIGR